MTDASRIIPIADLRTRIPAIAPQRAEGHLDDAFGRPLHDLRISVTDRCNFRCTYCMPKDVFDRDHRYLPHGDLLTFEEVARLAAAFVAHGTRKIRLTGGEPLLRRDIERLVAMLADLRTPDGERVDLAMTTNGSLLRRKAAALKAAGLDRLTVSLDALDDARFRAMNDVDFPVATVLDGIAAATDAGFGSVKVNMVVKRGVNDDQVEPMADHFRGSGHVVRFIEYMDVGASNGWMSAEVVPSGELVARLKRVTPIEPIEPAYRGEVAERWRYRDGSGEVGFVSSVSQPFCQDCSRARVSPEGKLYTCLFAGAGFDLRPLVRAPGPISVADAIAGVWAARTDRYSEVRHLRDARATDRIEMSYIGG